MTKAPTPKKEVISLRIEPKIRYLIDIAARVQRRNISNYVESALEDSLKGVDIAGTSKGKTIYELSDYLWSVSEAKRFISLALLREDLLSFEEQKLWSIMGENALPYITKKPKKIDSESPKDIDIDDFDIERVEKDWDILTKASFGDEDALASIKQGHIHTFEKMTKQTELINKTRAVLKKLNATVPQTTEDIDQLMEQLSELQTEMDSLKL